MLKWLIVVLAVVLVLGVLHPGLARRLPPGRLPGDIRLRLGGRDYRFPFASTALVSALAALIAWLL